jgi:hypothetical protein
MTREEVLLAALRPKSQGLTTIWNLQVPVRVSL